MRRVIAVASVVCGLVGMGCGGPAFATEVPIILGGRIRTAVRTLQDQRWTNVLHQGLDVSCGTAALATILHFQFGDGVGEDELIGASLKYIKEEEVRRRGGFSLLDLKRAAADRGYNVQGFKLSLEQLAGLKQAAIVPVTIRKFKHFVVFRGMVEDHVVLADPAFGNTTLSAHDFQRIWNSMALIVTQESRGDFPSHLKVVSDDALHAETPSIKRFIARGAFQTVFRRREY